MDPSRPSAWRLEGAASTYLRQHANDHVEWYPWGEEALQRAKDLDRLLFLSIGFAACHWCHVMAQESFQSARIGAELSSLFVCVKVDREERPDIDDLYIRLVQEMTGSAGWPLTVLLTPNLEPVWGGTYLPPFAGRGGPGLLDVARSMAGAWTSGPDRLRERAQAAVERLRRGQQRDHASDLPADLPDRSARVLLEDYDDEHGGFGGAPKFPRSQDLRLLMRLGQGPAGRPATAAALHSLERMAAGGMHDQLEGGFHRYSTDEQWEVPHFEKLLCDTALLVPAYLEGFQQCGRPMFASVARRACEWMLHALSTEHGGLAAGLDADGAGGEGTHCTWTQDELTNALGARRGGRAQEMFGVDIDGQLEDGRSVLSLAEYVAAGCPADVDPYADEEFSDLANALRDERAGRPHPERDELVVTGWNGLAVSALALACQVLDEERFYVGAKRVAEHVAKVALRGEGDLSACTRDGVAFGLGSLEDFAFTAQGFLDLFETDFDERWLHLAQDLTAAVEDRFRDEERGGYFLAQQEDMPLPLRTKDAADGALPSGHAVHALNLVRLSHLLGQSNHRQLANSALHCVGSQLARQPRRFSSLLIAHDFLHASPLEVVVAGEREAAEARALLRTLRSVFRPQKVVAFADATTGDSDIPILEGKYTPGATSAAYVCRNWTCKQPLYDTGELLEELHE